jgi:putative transposase
MQRFNHPSKPSVSSHLTAFYHHFHPHRQLMAAAQYRDARAKAFRVWRKETCIQGAA